MLRKLVTLCLTSLTSAAVAFAQTGTLDQESPLSETGPNSAQFNIDANFLVWQQQVRAGLDGTLEGVRLRLTGNAGATFNFRVRMGQAWSPQSAVFETLVTKSETGLETIFVDMTESAIALAVGDTYVLEYQGTDTGVWMIGSYVDPAIGPPLYPEPLWLMSGEFVPGWRLGFQTFMVAGGSPCEGDLDNDGVIGLQDMAYLLANFGVVGGVDPDDGDFDNDDDVDLQDLATLLAHFGTECP